MTDLQLKLLEYIDVNYDTVVVDNIFGCIIIIDLIPNADEDMLYNEYELLMSCYELGLDFKILLKSYKLTTADGIKMGRYLYLMQYTTSIILADLEYYRRMEKFKFIESL